MVSGEMLLATRSPSTSTAPVNATRMVVCGYSVAALTSEL